MDYCYRFFGLCETPQLIAGNRYGTVSEFDIAEWRWRVAEDNGFSRRYFLGDTDLDGTVDATDLNNLALNWNQEVVRWSAGDFNADGIVNAADLNELALNWQLTDPMAMALSLPEPSAAALAIFAR